jgi:hemolysin activation/secretion protein
VLAEQPSRLQTLERQLLLLNDRPGVRIADSTLEELGTATGKFRLTVTVETWRIYAAQGLDNLGSSAVGPLEGFLGSNLNSAFVGGDTLGVNLSTVPDAVRELQFGRAFYNAPIGRDGARLGVSALYSDEWPGDFQRQFDTHTLTETYEIKGSIPVLESRKASFWLSGAANLTESFGRDTVGVNFYDDHVRTISVIGDYRLQDAFGGQNYLTLIGRQGLDILGASGASDPFSSRDGAPANFSVLDLSYARYQALVGPFSLKVSLAGQLASTALLLSQQFYLGSAAYGPGFYNGDNGIAGLMELRLDQPVQSSFLQSVQLYGFLDRGAVWNVGDSQDALQLSSAGAGLRFYFPDALQASVAVAVPVHDHATPDNIHSLRVLFSISNALKACPDRAQWRCL